MWRAQGKIWLELYRERDSVGDSKLLLGPDPESVTDQWGQNRTIETLNIYSVG